MKKVAIVIALTLSVGLGSIAAAKPGDAVKVKSKVKVSYDPGGSTIYEEDYLVAKFKGKVKGKQGCKKGRSVKIKGVGKAKTNKKGRFEIGAGQAAAPGEYQAKVKKKTIKGKGSKPDAICSKASAKVTVS